MNKRIIAIVATVVLVVVIALSGFLATRSKAPAASEVQSPLLGHVAPGFTATTLSGASTSLADYRGRIVVLDFWSSWCVPCQQEAPELSTFAWQQRSAATKAVVLGVVFNDSVNSATSFEQKYGSLYPSVVDLGGTIANNYGVTSPPTAFVINAHGRIAATLFGAASASQLTEVVNRVASS